MLDHMILTVSNVERSLAFYEAALKPLNIKFFLPYKGENGGTDRPRPENLGRKAGSCPSNHRSHPTAAKA
jgi:catechol 2,3-dioxygenase-like lactoylglutathione lyase family enzyme